MKEDEKHYYFKVNSYKLETSKILIRQIDAFIDKFFYKRINSYNCVKTVFAYCDDDIVRNKVTLRITFYKNKLK